MLTRPDPTRPAKIRQNRDPTRLVGPSDPCTTLGKSASARASVSLAPVLGACTSARNRAHDMPDDASVNLASVSLASVRQRLSSAINIMRLPTTIFNTIFVSSRNVPREPRRDPSNRRLYEHGIWYISNTARNRTHNLFRPKCAPIPQAIVTDYHISIVHAVVCLSVSFIFEMFWNFFFFLYINVFLDCIQQMPQRSSPFVT